MLFDIACVSEANGRKENQDSCDYQEADGVSCFVLADGLGGHKGGAVASRTAVTAVLKSFLEFPAVSKEQLMQYLEEARHTMLKQAELENLSFLHTTLVVLLTDQEKFFWAYVGDSRLYFVKAGKVEIQTVDHSVPQQLAAGGLISTEEIRFHEDRNRLTAVFDGSEINKIGFGSLQDETEKGDAFLLCTDGFWEYVTEEMMEESLKNSRTAKAWLEEMERIVVNASEKGSDNYSAIAIIIL